MGKSLDSASSTCLLHFFPPLRQKIASRWRISQIERLGGLSRVAFLDVTALALLLAHRFIAPPKIPLSPAHTHTHARAILAGPQKQFIPTPNRLKMAEKMKR